MRRLRLASAGVVLACALAAGAAGAAAPADRATAPTKIAIDRFTTAGGDFLVLGHVSAAKRACRAGRVVKVRMIQTDGSEYRFDVAKTGDNGGWLGAHDLADVESRGLPRTVVARVVKSRVRSGGKRIVCGAKTARRSVN